MNPILACLALLSPSPRLAPEAYVDWAWQDAQSTIAAAQAPDAGQQRDIESDKNLGKKYSEEIDKELKPSEDKAMTERVQRIGAELALIANETQTPVIWGDKRLNRFDYTFKVVQEKGVNAFSLPGGTIYVYEGLVKYIESDSELAGVLAHEVAHAALRHVAALQREQSKVSAVQIPLIIAAVLTGKGGEALMATQLTTQAISSGWSVKAEQAADLAGFTYMVRSKYNPVGMLTMMERLAKDERTAPAVDWGIYRTHPPGQQRADALTEYLRTANIPLRRSEVTTSFRTNVSAADNGRVTVSFGKRAIVAFGGEEALKRADEAALRLNAFFDEDPELFQIGIGDDGTVVGLRRPLFQITPGDAEAAKVPYEEQKRTTVGGLRTVLYGLSYRVWNRR
jgi:predicted Zn-dependent protease